MARAETAVLSAPICRGSETQQPYSMGESFAPATERAGLPMFNRQGWLCPTWWKSTEQGQRNTTNRLSLPRPLSACFTRKAHWRLSMLRRRPIIALTEAIFLPNRSSGMSALYRIPHSVDDSCCYGRHIILQPSSASSAH